MKTIIITGPDILSWIQDTGICNPTAAGYILGNQSWLY